MHFKRPAFSPLGSLILVGATLSLAAMLYFRSAADSGALPTHRTTATANASASPAPHLHVASGQDAPLSLTPAPAAAAAKLPADAGATLPQTPSAPAPDDSDLAPPVDSVAARLHLPGGRALDLSPNPFGAFQRVRVAAQLPIPVTVRFSGGEKGDVVFVQPEDGGKVDSQLFAHPVALDESGAARFEFRPDASPGVYRVGLRKGAQTRTLDFWVGPDLVVAE